MKIDQELRERSFFSLKLQSFIFGLVSDMIPQVLESKFSDISRENVATKYSCNYLIAVIIIDLNAQNFSVDTTNLQYIYIYKMCKT